jgi:methyl-accepting chemotaxis protein
MTSAFFRLLLSDIRKLLAGLASDVANVASEVHVAAEGVERAIDIDDEWFSVLQDKVEETAQAVKDMNSTAKAKATAKDVFVARVQEVQLFFIFPFL